MVRDLCGVYRDDAAYGQPAGMGRDQSALRAGAWLFRGDGDGAHALEIDHS